MQWFRSGERSRQLTALLMLVGACGVSATSVNALGQRTVPVHWRMARAPENPVAAGGEFRTTVDAMIAAGWHLYAMNEPEGGPIATEFEAEAGSAAELLSVGAEPPLRGSGPLGGGGTDFYAGRAVFVLHLRLLPKEGAGLLRVPMSVRYQACNEKMCLPPRTDHFQIAVRRRAEARVPPRR